LNTMVESSSRAPALKGTLLQSVETETGMSIPACLNFHDAIPHRVKTLYKQPNVMWANEIRLGLQKSILKERQLQLQLQLNVHDSASPTVVQKRQREKCQQSKKTKMLICMFFCQDDHGISWWLLLLVVVVLILLSTTMEY
jgi:hypothetical protein